VTPDTPVPADAPSVDAVIFDLGNVVIGWDRALLYQQIIDDPVELDRFLNGVLTLDVNADLDRGVPLTEVTARLAAAHPADAELIAAFAERWPETLGPVDAGTVDIIGRLAGRVRRFALSNWGRDTFVHGRARMPFLDDFDGLVISGFEGVGTPDPRIWEVLCERHDVEPTRAVFVDDSPANVAVAADLGFRAIRFDTAADLERRLVELGLF